MWKVLIAVEGLGGAAGGCRAAAGEGGGYWMGVVEERLCLVYTVVSKAG